MKKNNKKTILLLGCVLLITVIGTMLIFLVKPTGSVVMSNSNIYQEDFEGIPDYLERALSKMVSEGKANGVVVSVVVRGKENFTAGYGFADKELGIPVDGAQTGFRIGSISKTFVAVAALQMAENNKLDLDAPVSRYLPEDFPPFEEDFTMKQLLTHSAGFEDILSGVAVYDLSKAEPLEVSVRKYMPNQIYTPGDISSYSNYGIALAAYVVQQVSGQKFSNYATENIFKPLNLNHTSFDLDFKGAKISKAYTPSGELTKEPYMNIYPEGSVVSTGEDMNRYMRWLMEDGNDILGDSAKRELLEKQYTASSDFDD